VVAPSNPMRSPYVRLNVWETSSDEHKSRKAVADSVYQARFHLMPLCRGCSAEAGAFRGKAVCPLPNLSLDSWPSATVTLAQDRTPSWVQSTLPIRQPVVLCSK
jgi:hypothetical protein